MQYLDDDEDIEELKEIFDLYVDAACEACVHSLDTQIFALTKEGVQIDCYDTFTFMYALCKATEDEEHSDEDY